MSLIDKVKDFILPRNMTTKQSKSSNNTTASGAKYNPYKRLSDINIYGLSYDEYKNIMKDSQVKVGTEILKYFLISKNYTLTSNSDDPEDIEITEFVQDCLDNMDTPFRDVIKDVLTAMKYGFSVQEKVYTLNNDGRIVVKGLYPLHIKTLQNNPFTIDKHGELTGIHQESNYGYVDLPLEKVILFSFDKEFDEYHGNSILNELKPVTQDKENTMDWLMTYNYKMENPVLVGKTDNGINSQRMLDAFDDIAAGATSITIDKGDDVTLVESSHRGETYFSTLQYKDNEILRRFFIGNLIFGDNSQTGSYAQSNTQQDTMLHIFDGILTDVATVFQKQLINELVKLNFGVDAKAPNFSFEKFVNRDMINLLNALKDYANMGAIDTDNKWFKELISRTVLTESDVKVNIDDMTDTNTELDAGTDYGYQEPMPGMDDVTGLVDEMLKGIV